MSPQNNQNNKFNSSHDKKIPSILQPEELSSILDEAHERSARDYLMIFTASLTGLRNSELLGLNICTVAPYGEVSNILCLPGTIAKGGYSREIPLREDLILMLNKFIGSKSDRNENFGYDDPLFVSHKTKKRLNPRDFQRIMHDISTKVLHRAVHPHILRHTFATKMLSHSNLSVVQKVLGHQNIQSTQVYTHPTSSDVLDAIKQI